MSKPFYIETLMLPGPHNNIPHWRRRRPGGRICMFGIDKIYRDVARICVNILDKNNEAWMYRKILLKNDVRSLPVMYRGAIHKWQQKS